MNKGAHFAPQSPLNFFFLNYFLRIPDDKFTFSARESCHLFARNTLHNFQTLLPNFSEKSDLFKSFGEQVLN